MSVNSLQGVVRETPLELPPRSRHVGVHIARATNRTHKTCETGYIMVNSRSFLWWEYHLQ